MFLSSSKKLSAWSLKFALDWTEEFYPSVIGRQFILALSQANTRHFSQDKKQNERQNKMVPDMSPTEVLGLSQKGYGRDIYI